MSWRVIPTTLEKGWRFPGIGPLPTFWSLMVDLETIMASLGVIYLANVLQWAYTDEQPSHLLSPPSSLALSLSQHQGLFQWVSSLHHWLNGHEFEQALGDSEGRLACCSPWGRKQPDTTEPLDNNNNTEDQGLVEVDCLPSWTHLILISLYCILWLSHSFKGCALPAFFLFQLYVNKKEDKSIPNKTSTFPEHSFS